MVKNIFKKITQSFCLYLLAVLNLIHAIETNSYDWLLWMSVALTVISLALCIISAAKEARLDAQA